VETPHLIHLQEGARVTLSTSLAISIEAPLTKMRIIMLKRKIVNYTRMKKTY
jgi:hypothetical protein